MAMARGVGFFELKYANPRDYAIDNPEQALRINAGVVARAASLGLPEACKIIEDAAEATRRWPCKSHSHL